MDSISLLATISKYLLVISLIAFNDIKVFGHETEQTESGIGTAMNFTEDEKLFLFGGFLQLLLRTSPKESHCHNRTKLSLQMAEEQVSWATKMVDASFKMPSGIQDGNLVWLGSFSECLNIRASDLSVDGQYCLVYVTPSSPSNQSLPKWYPPPSFIGTPLKIGVCVPSACSAREVEMAASSAAYSSLTFSVATQMCHQQGSHARVDAAAIAMICILSALVIIVILATLVDAIRGQSNTNLGPKSQSVEPLQSTLSLHSTKSLGTAFQVLQAFSLRANWGKIFNCRKSSTNDISVLHGIRFLSITWIIVGHTYGMNLNNAWTNSDDLPKMAPDFFFQVVLNGTIGVDSFLFLSGLLMSVGLLRNLTKNSGRMWVAKFLLRRYLRLVPAYAVVIGFAATLWQYLGHGPLWPEMLSKQNECRDNWWTNLLFINNFVHADRMCLNFSWFLANDMQLALIAPLFVYLLFRWPKIGIAVMTVCILLQWVALGAVAYVFNLAPSTGFLLIDPANSVKYYVMVYILPYTHFATHMIGIFTGYAISQKHMAKGMRTGEDKWRRKLIVAMALVGWAIAAVVGIAVVYGLWHWMAIRQIPSRIVSAVYNALARTAWALVLAWITLACLSGYGGIVNRFLQWRIFTPLSRLTYSVYLTHGIAIYSFFYNIQQELRFENSTMVFLFVSFLTIAHAIALCLCLFAEFPFIALENIIFNN